jgi:cytochrome c oxidase subunit III
MARTTAPQDEEIRRDSRPQDLSGKLFEPRQGRRVSTLPHNVMALPSETGIWVAVAAISMSFAALTSAMIVRQGIAPDWVYFQLPRILYFNTLILLVSSFTLETSRRWFAIVPDLGLQELRNEQAPARGLSWLYITMALGLLFVAGQAIGWRDLATQGLFLASSPSSSFFYVLTALHGVHLLGGIVGLAYVFWRLKRSAGPRQTRALGVASVYWHFMCGLWVFLLVLLAVRT